ncbi:electron transfer flavoprotein subunit alpha/FixB family protein [Pokkaliibacter sp. CJK22405]|uniref:electron transfer flavoprotein subunit alpha/FixB family protein n=1 Tax=Pokkaliibacter sp. CJK22405 TaxID=3384615 RepID=UPI003984C023
MSILVIAEHDQQRLSAATRSTLAAASLLPGDISVLVAGQHCQAVAEQAAQVPGVKSVRLAQADHYADLLVEELAVLVKREAEGCDYLLAGATTFGKNLLPRVAALLGVGQLSDVIAIESADTFKRPIYAGNAIATVQSLDAIKVLSIRATAFDASKESQTAAPIDNIGATAALGISSHVSASKVESARPELTSAEVVVSGGRGLGSKENFQMIEALADQLGGAVGASRAAVDAGFAPNDVQVGQTGKIVAPALYIAVGISGAIQHLAGMKGSKVIVAINKDPDAPIFQVADYGLVADLFEALPDIQSKL